jgi:hypothetical protein
MATNEITSTMPSTDASESGQTQDLKCVLFDLTRGMLGLQALLQSMHEEEIDGAVLGMATGAAAIVARMGLMADRAQAALNGTRLQDDDDWLDARESGRLAHVEGAAA